MGQVRRGGLRGVHPVVAGRGSIHALRSRGPAKIKQNVAQVGLMLRFHALAKVDVAEEKGVGLLAKNQRKTCTLHGACRTTRAAVAPRK